MTITNPLLLQNPIEKVDNIAPDYVVPAISAILKDNRDSIERLVVQETFTWENFMQEMEALDNRLSRAWSPVSHLNSVCNSEALREAYNDALALLTEYSTELGQHKGLFAATEALYEARDSLGLTETQIHILKDSLIGFKLSGLHLSEDKQKEYAKIQGRLAELKTQFEQNILDATMSWTKNIEDASGLSGLPETELAMLAANAEAREQSGFTITLEIPSYLAIITYADDRALRQELYHAYNTRASELGADQGKFDNSEVMAELLALRNQKAKLLGFNNYAELSLETKMAASPQEVLTFLNQLNDASHQQAVEEFEGLKAFASEQGVEDFQAWDVAYFSEKLKQKKFQISQSELRPYFPVDKVIAGLFKITEHHFNVTFKKVEGSAVWHKDVKHFEIDRDGQKVAEFYLDLYARGHKRGGAWMDDYQGRFKRTDGSLQTPTAYLTCNFAPPVKDKAEGAVEKAKDELGSLKDSFSSKK